MNPHSPSGRKPQRLKQRLREAADTAILEAAEAVLLERGLEAPMEAIAARAGVAVGTLYNHFRDRQALVAALLAHHRAQSQAEVEAAAARTAGEPVRAQLLAVVQALLSRGAFLSLLVKQNEQFPAMRRRSEVRARTVKLFGPVLERGRRAGALADDPDGLQPVALHGLLRAFFTLSADEPRRFPGTRVAEVVVDAFLVGASVRKGRA
ncbi:MAG: TetR/AcrR family transcriptional regulator [Polyangiaceae bacterium]|nr:TetR/AcrR family transcriptional regulator [Polyangiaceae bacterium]